MTGESLVRSFSKVLAVNAMSQESSISELLLANFKTAAKVGLYLQESSWCGAPCAKPPVGSRRRWPGDRMVNHL